MCLHGFAGDASVLFHTTATVRDDKKLHAPHGYIAAGMAADTSCSSACLGRRHTVSIVLSVPSSHDEFLFVLMFRVGRAGATNSVQVAEKVSGQETRDIS